MTMTRTSTLALLIALVAGAASAAEIMSVNIYPPAFELNNQRDSQRFIVVATRDDGVTLDLTKLANLKLATADAARLEGNTIHPVADGETKLVVEYEGRTIEAPVKVTSAANNPAISFHNDVMPVFMRSGCNTGSCHGAARGKDGFMLSLFGYDPKGDHHRVTREIGFRRINLAIPEESLLLTKSVGSVPHTGGKRFDTNDPMYATLLRWLNEGAQLDQGEVPAVTKVDIYPPQAVLEGEGTTQQFVAVAHFSDGTSRDVTDLAVFMSNNDNSAPIDPSGLVTAAARGEAFITVRYDTHTVGSQVLVLPKDLQYTPPQITGNYVDELIGQKLKKLRMLPSEICTDEEFLRRVTIDITGTLPTDEEYAAFTADTSPDKRAKLVTQLLDRKEFSEIWAMKWAELLMVKSSNQVSYKSMFLYSSWLTDQVANNVPLDQMVKNLLSASGGTFTEPQTNFYQIERDTLKTAENVAQVFMGIRTQCAQCHNHPFDRWTMDDYYSFAAFFSQIGRKTGEDYRETIVYNRNSGDVRHPVGNRVMEPKYLGGDMADVKGKDRREALAEWLTAPDNPFFAKNVANRVWAHFFGQGIVEPVDDIRVTNPASNQELLDTLGTKLVDYKYDFKKLVFDICTSEAYQRSVATNATNEHDTRNFASMKVRRIPAEMLLDCISQVTDTQDKFRGLPLGARAVQIADGRTSTYFLTTFGRASRETVCACEVKTEPTLSQALHLINGSTVQGKMGQGAFVANQLKAEKTPPEVIDAIFVRCLSRLPSEEERQRLTTIVGEAPSPQQGLEDVFWAVLNSREFLFNH